jgi:hypothetical protein
MDILGQVNMAILGQVKPKEFGATERSEFCVRAQFHRVLRSNCLNIFRTARSQT